VLLALFLAQRAARIVGVAPHHVWNVSVIALFAALAGSRLLLAVINWRDLRRHPLWAFGLSRIHSPVLAAIVTLLGALAAFWYIRWQRMPRAATLDVLSAPLVVALACEQAGALLAGSDYGTDASVPWAVIYTHPLATRWSGTPLGVPLHPVQAYAALAYLTLAVALLILLPMRRQAGDVAGVMLMGVGVVLFTTEFWRDPEGRGQLLHGALDGPQIAAIILLFLGALLLRERRGPKSAHAEAVP
jgi:phosphatidylglycerol:prolipoprotein diacylglycerol transferase